MIRLLPKPGILGQRPHAQPSPSHVCVRVRQLGLYHQRGEPDCGLPLWLHLTDGAYCLRPFRRSQRVVPAARLGTLSVRSLCEVRPHSGLYRAESHHNAEQQGVHCLSPIAGNGVDRKTKPRWSSSHQRLCWPRAGPSGISKNIDTGGRRLTKPFHLTAPGGGPA